MLLLEILDLLSRIEGCLSLEGRDSRKYVKSENSRNEKNSWFFELRACKWLG